MLPRKTIATVAVGALALGIFVGMFGKFGLGPGSGGSVGITSTRVDSGTAATAPPPSAASASKAPADIGALEGELQQIVLLRLTGEGLQVADWDGRQATFRTVTLAEAVHLAAERPGLSDGLRVRIRREPTSKAKAEADLQSELRRAGIPDDAVEWDGGARP